MKDIYSAFCQFASVGLVLAGLANAFESGVAQAASADLWQARNGSVSAPASAVDWVKGNVGPDNSHYIEGHSIPYRLVMSGLAVGPHRVIIEWDTRQKGKHALDFITHYNRLLPHNQFGTHTEPETINPLAGLTGPFGASSTFPIPTPSSTGSPVAGQPTTSFQALSSESRSLTIWNGSVTNTVYVFQGALTSDAAVTRLAIDFVATNPTVVLSFGSHIASKLDWGVGNSAPSIGGSPYHMRLDSLDGSGGNQDRSVQALAVLSPPTAAVSGPQIVCGNTTNAYVAVTDATNAPAFQWSLSNNSSGAVIVGPNNESVLQVAAGDGDSSYSVNLVVTADGLTGSSVRNTVVQPATTATALVDQTRCRAASVTFETSPAGTGPFSFIWRKDGQVLGNATNGVLTLPNLLASDAGVYCVEVTGACGTETRCATLTMVAPTALICPPDVAVQCLADVPPPAPEAVVANNGSEAIGIIHAGDRFQTNGSIVTITRTYATAEMCPVSCQQIITVQDTTAPAVVCPANLVRLEDAPDSAGAPVDFAAPAASDYCDTAPSVVCTPPSGSRFTVGDSVVNCVATDAAGNSSSCTFAIRVVPRTIVASSTADSGPGTLRQALLDANAAEGPNVIKFAFPGVPPYVIHLLSPLPQLSDQVVIDGWSQLQFQGSPVIEVNGTNAVPTPPAAERIGLDIAVGGATVRGLILNGFTTGIRAGGSGGHIIQGNFIGIDPANATGGSNTGNGLVIISPNNLIGGLTPQAGNVISRNGGHGIVLQSPLAISNVVVGNLIGTAIDGVTPAGNGQAGVAIMDGASNNSIGPGNTIANNGANGVLVELTAGSGNGIRGNVITGNGQIGIDLGGDGVTGNDTGDEDTGANETQNFPVLVSARTDGATTVIRGKLESVPRLSYSIEVFARTRSFNGNLATPALISTVGATTDAAGLTDFEATVAAFLPAGSQVFATATDPANSTSEFSPTILVGSAPIILTQPVGATAPPGGSAAFCVTASGTEPLTYQWRRNGANIPGATNECLFISSVELADGGAYTVVIANELGAVTSDPALLVLDLPRLAPGDNFVDRTPLFGPAGIASGTNLFATREPGEPLHAGKPGGSSVWYTWTAPDTGIATFRTTGSTFDTLLGVYSGPTVGSLTNEASDEDQGGFYTSGVRFNTIRGRVYQIAIDGFGGASGDFVFAWSLEVTDQFLPVITNQPISLTVASGSSATFVVGAVGNCRYIDHDCRNGKDGKPDHPDPKLSISYQWYFNGVPIPGATSATLTRTNVQDSSVGIYTALVSNGARSLFSQAAILQINQTEGVVQNVQTADKFLDATGAAPLRVGVVLSGAPSGFQPASVVRGYTGTQVFNTAGSATEANEGPICGVAGGASQWISFIAEETGTVFLNTDGSSYDTVIAVLARNTNGTLQQLACDNNGGLDGRDSAVTIPTVAGRTNFIVIDGVNGAGGTLRLNYSLVTPSFLTPLGKTIQGANRVRVTGRTGVKFTIQASPNLSSWSSLITTNAPSGTFDYVDTRSTNSNPRYYRALLLP